MKSGGYRTLTPEMLETERVVGMEKRIRNPLPKPSVLEEEQLLKVSTESRTLLIYLVWSASRRGRLDRLLLEKTLAMAKKPPLKDPDPRLQELAQAGLIELQTGRTLIQISHWPYYRQNFFCTRKLDPSQNRKRKEPDHDSRTHSNAQT